MKPSICLINPPSIFLLDERTIPSLGMLKVAAVLEQQGYPVSALDLNGVENYEDVIREHIATHKVDWYGITATTPQMPAVNKITSVLRGCSSARIVLGGPHPTLISAARKKEVKNGISGRAVKAFDQMLAMFDSVVAGDGESAIFEVLNNETAFVDADEISSPLFLTEMKYEKDPFPARHLIDLDSYHYAIEGINATSLIAQLGCPFGCGFCGGRSSKMLRKIRTRSTDSIVRELRQIHERYGYKAYMFYDDELNVNKSIVELMYGIKKLQDELKTEFRLRGFMKSQLFTDEQAAAAKAAGFKIILVGFESGSARILDNINKQATKEENTRCVQIAKRHGLKIKALMSVGHPGESRETIKETEQWLLDNLDSQDDFDCTVISTYAGTPYYDEAKETSPGIWTYTTKSGDRLHAVEVDYSTTSDYYKGVPGEYKSYVYTDYLSSEEIVKLRDELEKNVREILGIKYNAGAPAVKFEASMGQLPGTIFRQVETKQVESLKLNVV